MSRSIDLFIDAPPGLDDLAAYLSGLTGLVFDPPDGGDRRVLHSGGVTLELAEHDLVDDRELLFTRYRYALTAVLRDAEAGADGGEARLLRQVFSSVKADNRFACLLVFDLQHLLDQCPPQPSGQVPR